jgi:hypothetical protein
MTEIDVIITTLEEQRNAALAMCVNLKVQNFQLQTEIDKLKAEIAERDKPIVPPE